MNRTKNAVRNIWWGIIQKFILLLFPFITRTFLIRFLGAEYLGLSGLFTSILSLLSLTELGISSAIISTMYKPIADNDTDTVCALMAFYRKVYYIIGGVITALGILMIPFLHKFIKGDLPIGINLYILYLIYLLNTAISYFLFSYKNCLLIAHQRNDLNSKIQSGLSIIQSFVQIIIIVFFKNYYCYAIVIPITTAAINIYTAHKVTVLYPQYICKGKLSSELFSDIKERVYGLLLGKVSSTIRSSVDSLFISMFLGLAAVAMYSNYFYIVTAIIGIIQIVDTSLVAGVGNSITMEPKEKNYDDFLIFTFILQWIVGWCAICILCLEQPFMEIWMGRELMFKDTMVYLCAIYLFVNCIGIIRSVYTQALGQWWSLRYLSLIDVFVNIFMNYFLGKNFGAYGIMLATIADIVLVSIPWTTYYLFRDYFGKKYYLGYMLKIIVYMLMAGIAGGITFSVCRWIQFDNLYLTFAIKGIVCVVFPNIFYLIVFIKTTSFNEAINFIKKKILKK